MKNLNSDYVIEGQSAPVRHLLREISYVMKYDVPVLVVGERGTGKELVARKIHSLSSRHQMPFVPVNCSYLSEELGDDQLFGHVRGAFTGAVADTRGLFKLADHGTIFLDEVGDLPKLVQPKFLRVLQDGTFTPVGSERQETSDARIIAATNKPVKDADAFRQDLYDRVGRAVLEVPPLRARKEDIDSIVGLYARKWNAAYGETKSFLPESMMALHGYDYPGNVRELENIAIDLLMHADDGYVTPEMVQDKLEKLGKGKSRNTGVQNGEECISMPFGMPLYEAQQQLEKEYVIRALRRNGDNVTAAAAELGLSRNGIDAKIKRHGIYKQDCRKLVDEGEKTKLISALRYTNGNYTEAARALDMSVKTLYRHIIAYGNGDRHRFHTENGIPYSVRSRAASV